MNVILLTVLLTLLGVGLVVLLVWLSVASWKSMKHRKQLELDQQSIWNQIDMISTELVDEIRKEFTSSNDKLHQRIDDVYNLIDKQVNELHDNRDRVEENIYEDMGKAKKELNENIQSLNKLMVNLESTVDSRFDKVYNTITFNQNQKN